MHAAYWDYTAAEPFLAAILEIRKEGDASATERVQADRDAV
jgi:hypothetical protein